MTGLCYLLIDLEATCAQDGSIAPREMETIEIGAVMVAADSFATVSEFQSFVRPQRHPMLTPFCIQLTSIRQQDVDEAEIFPDVLRRFREWIYRHEVTAWASWGDYDRLQFEQDCALHGQPWPFGFQHKNFKEVLRSRHAQTKRLGLSGAVARAGLPFVGTPHRGIDDARNIAQLMPFIVGDAALPAEVNSIVDAPRAAMRTGRAGRARTNRG